MKIYKKYRLSLLCLALTFVFALCALFGLNASALFAAASGTVTVSTDNIFTGSGEADVIAYELVTDGDDDNEYYTMFTFGDETGTISYRKNLAYHWYEADEEDEDGLTGTEKFYNMEIGLVGLEFEKFVIKYDSSEYNLTKDGKTTNYIIFYPCADDSTKVYVTVTDDEETGLDTENFNAISADRITIAFTGKYDGTSSKAGGYSVKIGYGDEWYVYEFENVGGNYVKNSTSSTKPVAPITFYCTFAEDAESEREAAKMVLYSLNGQSFLLSGVSYSDSGEYYYGGTVTDDCPPVLCLDTDFRFVELGGEIDIDYVVIDVLRSSPRATLSYGVLTCDSEETISYSLAELSSSDEILIETDVDKYYPVAGDYVNADTYDDEDLVADMAIKIKFTLTDITSNGESCDIYLDWYVAEDYLLEIDTERYVAVATDNLGATYNYGGIEVNGTTKTWAEIISDYQDAVTEAAKNLSAGSSSYIYLPSCEELFSDNSTAYTDLTIGVYYYSSSQSSNAGLSSSGLCINLSEQGNYVFTIYATDASGNKMYYIEHEDGDISDYGSENDDKIIYEDDEKTIPKRVEFATGDIWTMYEDEDEGLQNYIPWFKFSVGYTGAEFDEVPGKQSTAYVGTSYTAASFSINGISGMYSVSYRLFLFDRAGYYELTGVTLTYDEYVEMLDELWENYRTLFSEITALADLEEDDDDYEDYCDYEWSTSSTSFVPQDDNSFYLIRAELTDTYYSNNISCNMGIVASVAATTLKGESEWLKNNIASIVLLSIAGASLIGIVVLLVIKPKDKTDIDVKLEEDGKKKKKPKKNKAE